MSNSLEELPIPDVVRHSGQCAELVRVWLADGSQVVTISDRLWNDPGTWGLMLVDLAKHVARAYAQNGVPEEFALAKIREAMAAEWTTATDSSATKLM